MMILTNKKPISKHAFSLIELSIVILIIGILVAGVTQSSRLVKRMRIASASQLTTNSDVNTINDLTMWLESVQDFAFATGTNASFDFSSNVYNDVDRPSDQDRIGRWNDESMRNSSSKKSAIQNNLARQPKYVENGINSLPALYFDGSGQGICMHAPVNIDRAMMPNLTIFAVYRWTTIETGSTQKLWGSDNGGWDRQAIMGAPFVGISYGSGAATIPNFGNRNVNQIFSHVSRVGVGNGSMAYINGQSPTYFTESNTGPSYQALTIAGNNNQGGNNSLDGNCVDNTNILIGEFILFERALNSEERSAVEKYLAKKWGIKL